MREALVSTRYHQGLYNPEGFHFHPLNYARALGREIERLGGVIFEGSPTRALSRKGGVQVVVTPAGEVRAREAVIASGGYTGPLIPQLERSYLPIATYVMLTGPDEALIASAIRTTAGMGDNRRAGDYYRLVDGGRRILWGGKITTRTSEPRRLARLLRQTMVSTYPQLKDLPVDIAWSGLMAYARHRMPQIGRLPGEAPRLARPGGDLATPQDAPAPIDQPVIVPGPAIVAHPGGGADGAGDQRLVRPGQHDVGGDRQIASLKLGDQRAGIAPGRDHRLPRPHLPGRRDDHLDAPFPAQRPRR